MCELCDLNNSKDGFVITMCKKCLIPLVVSREHKPAFTIEDKQRIIAMFPDRKIRWEMIKILDHAHAHILEVNNVISEITS